jgi:hypothetical protein
MVEQKQARTICPVQVVEHEQHRSEVAEDGAH